MQAVIERARFGKPFEVVSDQVGSPTRAVDIAEAVLALIDCRSSGTVHFSSQGCCSRLEEAREALQLVGEDPELAVPVRSSLRPRPAERPKYSVLDSSLYRRLTSREPPDWRSSLAYHLSGEGDSPPSHRVDSARS